MKISFKPLGFVIFVVSFTLNSSLFPQKQSLGSQFTIARLKYNGGGDWYNDPSSIPNMLNYLKRFTNINAAENEIRISLLDDDLFMYPFLFMTGHGRISFSSEEANRLRLYLSSGGFLYADDDYGMDEHFRREMKKVFPGETLIEIPFSHGVYHIQFDFVGGLPKIHEHDGGIPKGFGLFHDGRLVTFYTFNTNISDGWADPEVHGDSQEIREMAFRMGTNIIVYALMN